MKKKNEKYSPENRNTNGFQNQMPKRNPSNTSEEKKTESIKFSIHKEKENVKSSIPSRASPLIHSKPTPVNNGEKKEKEIIHQKEEKDHGNGITHKRNITLKQRDYKYKFNPQKEVKPVHIKASTPESSNVNLNTINSRATKISGNRQVPSFNKKIHNRFPNAQNKNSIHNKRVTPAITLNTNNPVDSIFKDIRTAEKRVIKKECQALLKREKGNESNLVQNLKKTQTLPLIRNPSNINKKQILEKREISQQKTSSIHFHFMEQEKHLKVSLKQQNKIKTRNSNSNEIKTEALKTDKSTINEPYSKFNENNNLVKTIKVGSSINNFCQSTSNNNTAEGLYNYSKKEASKFTGRKIKKKLLEFIKKAASSFKSSGLFIAMGGMLCFLLVIAGILSIPSAGAAVVSAILSPEDKVTDLTKYINELEVNYKNDLQTLLDEKKSDGGYDDSKMIMNTSGENISDVLIICASVYFEQELDASQEEKDKLLEWHTMLYSYSFHDEEYTEETTSPEYDEDGNKTGETTTTVTKKRLVMDVTINTFDWLIHNNGFTTEQIEWAVILGQSDEKYSNMSSGSGMGSGGGINTNLTDEQRELLKKNPNGDVGLSAIQDGLQYLGCDYQLGGYNGVNVFDCSTFTMHVYSKDLGISQVTGTAADQANILYKAGYIVYQDSSEDGGKIYGSLNDLEIGDLIFYRSYASDNGRFMCINHVGMYYGDGQTLEAGGEEPTACVRVRSMYGLTSCSGQYITMVGRPSLFASK